MTKAKNIFNKLLIQSDSSQQDYYRIDKIDDLF